MGIKRHSERDSIPIAHKIENKNKNMKINANPTTL